MIFFLVKTKGFLTEGIVNIVFDEMGFFKVN